MRLAEMEGRTADRDQLKAQADAAKADRSLSSAMWSRSIQA